MAFLSISRTFGRRLPRRFPPLSAILELRRQRRRLLRLDDAALRDLGLTRQDVRTEANRPFWDVPQHWLR